MKKTLFIFIFSICLLPSYICHSQNQDSAWIVSNYYKIERMITMRDGKKLFTSIYIPKDSSVKHPIMMTRTPYSCAPYGENKFRNVWSRNTKEYFLEKYIVVFQDVRGRYMSEGEFEDIRPKLPTAKTQQGKTHSNIAGEL